MKSDNSKGDHLPSESQCEQIISALEDYGMKWWQWDIPGRILLASPGIGTGLKTGRKGLINEDDLQNFIRKIEPTDLQELRQQYADMLEGKLTGFSVEFRYRDDNDRLKWWHSKGTVVLHDKEGKPLRIVGLAQNITPIKQNQIELIEAKQRAEESDRLKSAFLANMSHEIRTPMNAILGFSELLSDPKIQREEIANYTKIIKERSAHLLQIMNDILDISRIEANQVDLKEFMVSLNQLMDDLYLYYAQKLINDKKLRIQLIVEKELPDKDCFFLLDAVRLRQILGNLLDNAVKFTREGSIRFGYKAINRQLIFHVSDTGIGIPAEKHEQIFERFRQLDVSLSRQYGGNGLGLAICKAFVELMGGKIWLESEPGSGSVFYFYIRTGENQQDGTWDSTENLTIPEFHWTGKRILLVEDDISSTLFMKGLFEQTGVYLQITNTAEETLQLFRDNISFDLVLMDVQLPDDNGLELTRHLKKMRPELPVIVQTAYAMAGDDLKCKQAGCDDYVSKPIIISDLFYKINHYLTR